MSSAFSVFTKLCFIRSCKTGSLSGIDFYHLIGVLWHFISRTREGEGEAEGFILARLLV
jgi:hypothetical protein